MSDDEIEWLDVSGEPMDKRPCSNPPQVLLPPRQPTVIVAAQPACRQYSNTAQPPRMRSPHGIYVPEPSAEVERRGERPPMPVKLPPDQRPTIGTPEYFEWLETRILDEKYLWPERKKVIKASNPRQMLPPKPRKPTKPPPKRKQTLDPAAVARRKEQAEERRRLLEEYSQPSNIPLPYKEVSVEDMHQKNSQCPQISYQRMQKVVASQNALARMRAQEAGLIPSSSSTPATSTPSSSSPTSSTPTSASSLDTPLSLASTQRKTPVRPPQTARKRTTTSSDEDNDPDFVPSFAASHPTSSTTMHTRAPRRYAAQSSARLTSSVEEQQDVLPDDDHITVASPAEERAVPVPISPEQRKEEERRRLAKLLEGRTRTWENAANSTAPTSSTISSPTPVPPRSVPASSSSPLPRSSVSSSPPISSSPVRSSPRKVKETGIRSSVGDDIESNHVDAHEDSNSCILPSSVPPVPCLSTVSSAASQDNSLSNDQMAIISSILAVKKEFEETKNVFLMDVGDSSPRVEDGETSSVIAHMAEDDIKNEFVDLEAIMAEKLGYAVSGGNDGMKMEMDEVNDSFNVNADATDDNVEAALVSIYSKANHRPEKGIRATLETKDMRTAHPVDLDEYFTNPGGNSGTILPTDAQLKKALRKEMRENREERKAMYARFGMKVPSGRPNLEKERILREKLRELDNSEAFEEKERQIASFGALMQSGADIETLDIDSLLFVPKKEELFM